MGARHPSRGASEAVIEGQHIVVTGSTRGIGRAIAEALLDAGCTVGIHGRSRETVAGLCAGKSAVPLAGDFSDPAVAKSLIESFIDSTGRIDGLVNNAGGGDPIAFRGLTLERWRKTQAANLESALQAMQGAYPAMRKQRAGAIVNIASLAAHGPGLLMGADYAASKAALVSLTKSFAMEAARFGIRCNAISPGFVETDMTADLPDDKKQNLAIPLGRLGRPEEIAAVARFLLSDDASYMTGQVVHVDGGMWMAG